MLFFCCSLFFFFCSFEEKPCIVNGFLYIPGVCYVVLECQIIIVVGDGDASTIIKSDLPYAQLCLMVIKRLCHEIFTETWVYKTSAIVRTCGCVCASMCVCSPVWWKLRNGEKKRCLTDIPYTQHIYAIIGNGNGRLKDSSCVGVRMVRYGSYHDMCTTATMAATATLQHTQLNDVCVWQKKEK